MRECAKLFCVEWLYREETRSEICSSNLKKIRDASYLFNRKYMEQYNT